MPPATSATAPQGNTTASGETQGVRLRIHNEWVLIPAAWMEQHPGGSAILKLLDGKDATDAFFALHSEDAVKRMMNFPKVAVDKSDPSPSKIALAFRKFRADLEKDGYFQRSIPLDLLSYLVCVSLAVMGTYYSYSNPLFSIFLLGVCMQQSGWLGHDLAHGRGSWCYYAGRAISGVLTGFSPKWWSDKHNTHHCFPNFEGIDMDIANDPVFHLWIPAKDKDVFIRKYQHLYFLPVCCFIYVSWRIQSIQWLRAKRDWAETFYLVLGYIWLLCLPLHVSIGAILLGGFFVGVVVTATHQSEPLTSNEKEPEYDFCKHQFDSTRNADTTNNWIMHQFWGGMQYQLEHHLFPTMPRYYLASVAERTRKFAKENGLDYRMDGIVEILVRNLTTMKHFALSPAVSN